MRIVLVLPLIFFAFSASSDEPSGTIIGKPRVSDGDTFQFAIRLFGVDTPETQQVCADAAGTCYRCGSAATDFMEELFDVSASGRARNDVTCTFTGSVTYGRAVASCEVDGKDAGEALIRAGWALAYKNFLRGTSKETSYISAENAARASGAGMWSGEFVPPSDFRDTGKRVDCEW